MISEFVEQLSPYSYALPLSFSKGNTLLTCGRKYDLQYIKRAQKIEAPHKEVMVVGKFTHKVLELCLNKAQHFGWEQDAVDFGGSWMQVHKQMPMTLKEYDMTESLRVPTEEVFHKLMSAIRTYRMKVFPEMMICMSRTGKVAPSIKWNNRFFYGFIDFIGITPNYKKALVIDYKSHSKNDDDIEKTALQLSTYAYCLFMWHPELEQVQYGVAYLPDTDIDLQPAIVRGSDEYQQLEDRVFSFFREYIEKLNAKAFAPTASKLCDWCEYVDKCEAIHEF